MGSRKRGWLTMLILASRASSDPEEKKPAISKNADLSRREIDSAGPRQASSAIEWKTEDYPRNRPCSECGRWAPTFDGKNF